MQVDAATQVADEVCESEGADARRVSSAGLDRGQFRAASIARRSCSCPERFLPWLERPTQPPGVRPESRVHPLFGWLLPRPAALSAGEYLSTLAHPASASDE